MIKEFTKQSTDFNSFKLPLYRGFNLQAKVYKPGIKYSEFDFETMALWGFNFVRLPLSYWTWSSKEDWFQINEKELEDIDDALEMGKQYGLHINLNLHRIPGYCVNGRDLEPYDLFSENEEIRHKAMKGAVFHWKLFAKRYKNIPSSLLSFDLINEPPFMKPYDRYLQVVKILITAIREIDPQRIIFVDGIDIGQTPVTGIDIPGIVQSTRGYQPKALTHYTANWVPENEFETFNPPEWPLKDDKGRIWNKEMLRKEYIEKWKPLTDIGVQVHVGEWGAFNKTSHKIVLSWMADCISLWREAGWGNSLWEFRGNFGVLDSNRTDVDYEDYKGHKLDRKMLEILKSY